MFYRNISIIIPFLNSSQTIERNLKSLINLDYPKEKIEILYVDDGSTDRSLTMIEDFQKQFSYLHIVRQKHRGIAAARNLGVKKAKYSTIAFIDSDCFAKKNWLRKINQTMSAGEKVVAGRVIPDFPCNNVEEFLARQDRLCEADRSKNKDAYFITANLAFRKTIFDKIGYFDENLISGEDADFSWRLARQGVKIKYCREAVVTHKMRGSITSMLRWAYRDGKGWSQLEEKYNMRPRKYHQLKRDFFQYFYSLVHPKNTRRVFSELSNSSREKVEEKRKIREAFFEIMYLSAYLAGCRVGFDKPLDRLR